MNVRESLQTPVSPLVTALSASERIENTKQERVSRVVSTILFLELKSALMQSLKVNDYHHRNRQ
jgi:hypothetical protein